MIHDKTYCLHHPELTDRKKILLDTFDKQNINVEWIEGFGPETILQTPVGMKNKGELSLYLKHLHVFQEQIKNNYKRILIFEDDVILPDDFNTNYSKYINEFEDLGGDILFLGICCGILPKNIQENKHVYYDSSYRSRCTHCYCIKIEATIKIIDKLNIFNKPIDWKLNECIETSSLKSCYLHPGIHQASQAGKFPSSLYN